MKFKTIVLTRKKIAAVLIILLIAVILLLLSKTAAREAVTTFAEKDVPYEEILGEGLPNGEEKKIGIKNIIKKILGLDIEKPESVIAEYSAAFDAGEAEKEETAEETSEATAEEANESAEPASTDEEVKFPDKNQIYTSVGLKISNATDYNIDIDSLCGEKLPFERSDGPEVLIMHTHTTECYDGDQMQGETERNTDGAFNVTAVGDEICSVLEKNGIETIHDTTYHDYPSYQGAYSRALTTIDKYLKEYPSIKIVLDVHRDAFVYSDGSKLRVACEQNGVNTAQVMIVAGTNSMGLWHENWRDNLSFAAKIQNAAEIMYPGLMRPINVRNERFNEHMTRGSLILEVGSNGNSLDEAKNGGRCAANAIAAVLNAE